MAQQCSNVGLMKVNVVNDLENEHHSGQRDNDWFDWTLLFKTF